jgi:glycerol-3-phosphate dehydrogenase
LPEGSIGRLHNLPANKLSNVHPALKSDRMDFGYVTSDASVDSPVRLCLENLLSANNHGAVAANYAKVVSIQVHNRQVQGVTLEDRISGKSLRVQGRCIINASGPWMDQICKMADDRFISRHRILQETYAVIPQLNPPLEKALWFSSSQDGRIIEILPWKNYLVLGPFIENAGPNVDAPRSDSQGIDALFAEVCQLLPSLQSPQEALFYASTALCLAAADAGRPAIARGNPPWVVDHGRIGGPKGLLSAIGAKLFNYRRVAQQVVDAAKPHAGTPEKSSSQSHLEPLYGGNIQNMATFVEEVTNAARNYALSDSQVRHLVGLYGTKSQEIFQWLKSHPDLSDPICPHHPDIKAQLLYSVDREMAVSVGDVLLRRTLIGLTGCRGLDCVQTVADTLARHLGWSEARVGAEIDNYQDELRRIFWTN